MVVRLWEAQNGFRETIAARDAHAVIRPRKNAKPWKPTGAGAIARNDAVHAQRCESACEIDPLGWVMSE